MTGSPDQDGGLAAADVSVEDRFRRVRQRMVAACLAADRDISEVRLLPVSKTKPSVAILALHRMGVKRFGENRIQEAQVKAEELAAEDVEWAIVGHLQTNKARHMLSFASEFQALDSLRIAAELDKRLHAAGRQLDVLVQVNSSGEPQKYGFAPDEVMRVRKQLAAFDALNIRGLMTLAVFSDDKEKVGRCFEVMRDLQATLQDADGGGWEELSMGMSGDFELAIEHGSTCVRVGEAIFGPRAG